MNKSVLIGLIALLLAAPIALGAYKELGNKKEPVKQEVIIAPQVEEVQPTQVPMVENAPIPEARPVEQPVVKKVVKHKKVVKPVVSTTQPTGFFHFEFNGPKVELPK